MNVWTKMLREEEDLIWDRFYSRYNFRPSVSSEEWPAIDEPTPSVTYSLVDTFVNVRDREELLAKGSQLNQAMLEAFRQCTSVEESLYVLDWQHLNYQMRPHEEFPSAKWSEWETPVFPDGDYYIFLQKDFRFGTFGHPWEQTLCVFGDPLLSAFDEGSVTWLGPVKRRDGVVV